MIGSLFVLSVSLGGVPEPKPTAEECPQTIPIEKGQPMPAELVDDTGRALCSGLLEPTSSFAHLLAIEKHAETADKLHALDVSILQTERDWYKKRLEEEQEMPWWQTPQAQRTIGRLETLGTLVVVAGIVAGVYNIENGR
tara:strand:- start:436 stop:855 length:420 start_codon:yes stop_codon:yes gene_type:complete